MRSQVEVYLFRLVLECLVRNVDRVLKTHVGTVALINCMHHGLINVEYEKEPRLFGVPVRDFDPWKLLIELIILLKKVQIQHCVQNLIVVLLRQILLVMHRPHSRVFWRWQVLLGRLLARHYLCFIGCLRVFLLAVNKLCAKSWRVYVVVALDELLGLLLCFIRIHILLHILLHI
jgi:hypothetical protein